MSDIADNKDLPPDMRKINESKLSSGKYGVKEQQSFAEPVVRCDSCNVMVYRKHIHKMGCCPECGNRRFRMMLTMKGEELERLKKDGADPEYLALFAEVELD